MLKSERVNLDSAGYVISHSNIKWCYTYKSVIAPSFMLNDANDLSTFAGYGDSGLHANGSFDIDGDLIISMGWGDGVAVKRISDAGVISELFYDAQPLQPVTSYQYMMGLAVDKVNKKFYVGSHAYSGFAVYDYADTGNIHKDGMITTADGLPSQRCGKEYKNGLAIVGDYLYIAPNDAYFGQVLRWNTTTQQAENLDIVNYRTTGQGGGFIYDEVNNRLYQFTHYNAGLLVITNPDKSATDPTNPAKAYNLRLVDIFGSDDCYSICAVPDSVNPNHLWVTNEYRMPTKVDISGILAETATTPTILTENLQYRNKNLCYTKYLHNGYGIFHKSEYYEDQLILIHPYAGFCIEFGFFDQENVQPVAITRPYQYDDTGSGVYTYHSADPIRYDYGNVFKLIESALGNKFWITTGYGYDGYKFMVWDAAVYPEGMCLNPTANLTLGTFTMTENTPVGAVRLDNLKSAYSAQSGCSLVVSVSNNNGANWEVYDHTSDDPHEFSSTGYQVRVKFDFQGTKYKTAYIQTDKTLGVTMFQKDNIARTSYRKHARLRITGV